MIIYPKICPDFPKSIYDSVYDFGDFDHKNSISLGNWIPSLKSYFLFLDYFDQLRSCEDIDSLDNLINMAENSTLCWYLCFYSRIGRS